MQINNHLNKLVPIASIIGAILAYKAIEVSWEIAKVSGSLDKPAIEVGISGFPLSKTGITRIILGASQLSDADQVSIGSIPFSFTSAGKKTAEEINITFQYNKMFNRSALELMESKGTGEFGAATVAHQYSQLSDTSFVSYHLDSLNPGVEAVIADPIFISPTTKNIDIPITTKDKIRMIVNARIDFALKYGFTISSKDSPLRSNSIDITMTKIASLEELSKSEILFNIIRSERKNLRSNLSFINYLGGLLFSSKEGKIFLVFCPLNKVEQQGYKIFESSENNQVKVARYPLLSWELLFSKSNTES